MTPENKGFTTEILHADRLLDPEFGAIHQPIHHSVTWGYNDVGDLIDVFQNKSRGYAYSRQGNPTVTALEKKISKMESGIGTIAFSSGMAAITAILIAFLKAGDHLLSSSFLFGNTKNIFHTFEQKGIAVTFRDPRDIKKFEASIRTDTRMIFVETIANPGTQIADLEAIGKICQMRGLIFVVDNTITTPYFYRPKNSGASLIVNSLTKYIGGHGNAVGGSVTDTGLFDWNNYANIVPTFLSSAGGEMAGLVQLRKKALRDAGACLSPELASLIALGAETLALRMERSSKNAMVLAEFLEAHPKIRKVNYPGLVSHPQHLIARKSLSGYSSLMSFELDNGIDVIKFLNNLKVVIKSSNLGDTRTLAIPVAQTIFFELGPEKRKEMEISESLVRVSVGIEDQDDLLDDFRNALNAC